MAEETSANSASIFEQILEVMPQDKVALHTLAMLRRKEGRSDEALVYLRRLAAVVIDTKDRDSAADLIAQLNGLRSETPPGDFPDALCEKLQALAGPAAGLTEAPDATKPKAARYVPGCTLEAEARLVQQLHEKSVLDDEDAAKLMDDLEQMVKHDAAVPVTVLHILEAQGYGRMPSVMSYLSEQSGAPFITLAYFDLNTDAAKLLPEQFMVHRGALPFGMVGSELLIAVCNPLDQELIDDAERLSCRKCHSFLISPMDYDARLTEIRQYLSET